MTLHQKETHDLDPKTTRRHMLIATMLHHIITVMMIVSAIALSIWSYLNFKPKDFFSYHGERDQRVEQLLMQSQIHKLEYAAQTYKAIHNKNISSLHDLIEERLIDNSDLHYPTPNITYIFDTRHARIHIKTKASTASHAHDKNRSTSSE